MAQHWENEGPKAAEKEASWMSWQMILGLILLALVAIFALINTQAVTVNFIVARLETSLIVVIAGSAAIGAVIALLASWRHRRHKSR